jgi:hypothetical protein
MINPITKTVKPVVQAAAFMICLPACIALTILTRGRSNSHAITIVTPSMDSEIFQQFEIPSSNPLIFFFKLLDEAHKNFCSFFIEFVGPDRRMNADGCRKILVLKTYVAGLR